MGSRGAWLPVGCVDPSQTQLTNQQRGGHTLHHSPGITVGAACLDPAPAPLGSHDPDPDCEPVELKLEYLFCAARHELKISPGRLECPADWLLLNTRHGGSPWSMKGMVVAGGWLYEGCLPREIYEVSSASLSICSWPYPRKSLANPAPVELALELGETGNKQNGYTFQRGL